MNVINFFNRVICLIRYNYSKVSDLNKEELTKYNEAIAYAVDRIEDLNPLIVTDYKFLLIFEKYIKDNKAYVLLGCLKYMLHSGLDNIYYDILIKKLNIKEGETK